MIKDMYTEKLEESLFQLWGEENEDEYAELLEVLNREESFNSFGEGLLRIIKLKYPDVEIDSLVEKIKEICTKKGIPLSDIGSINTLKNWIYKGIRPKKADITRDSLYALSFAFELSVEEVAELFNKVYLDRTFDYRNAKEVVYYYCIKNKISWNNAKELVKKVDGISVVENDATVYTQVLRADADSLSDEKAILEYVAKYRHNLSLKNKTAYKLLEELLEEANELAREEADKPYNIEVDGTSRFKGQNRKSNNFTYEVITNQKVNGETGTKTLFKNARLPKEIKNRFPEAVTIAKKDMTYEEIRKLMILLKSYIFWYRMDKDGVENCFDDYIKELNGYLFEGGLPEIYYGNPYDWLFLYCALSETPLDTFRGVLAEVLE